jgi:cytoskeletal protein RodZ
MQNKNTHRWLDVQIVIITIAMTVSLALWNLFAAKSQPVTQAQPATSSVSSPQTTIYFGNPAPQASAITAPSNNAPAFSAPSSAPAPITNTGSSRP